MDCNGVFRIVTVLKDTDVMTVGDAEFFMFYLHCQTASSIAP